MASRKYMNRILVVAYKKVNLELISLSLSLSLFVTLAPPLHDFDMNE